MNIGEIRNRLSLPTSDVTRLMDRLARRRLIQRGHRETSRRNVVACVTGRGQSAASRVRRLLRQTQRVLTAGMSQNEVAQLQKLLVRLAQ